MLWIYVLLVACMGLALVKLRRRRKARQREDLRMRDTASRAA